MTVQELAEKITNDVLMTVQTDGEVIAKTSANLWESLTEEILGLEVDGITIDKAGRGRPTITIEVTAEDADTEPGEEEPEPDDEEPDDGSEPDDSEPDDEEP